MNQQILDDASRDVLPTAVTGGDWLRLLEPIMDEMNVIGGGFGRALPPNLFAIATSGLGKAFVALRPTSPTVTAADDLAGREADVFRIVGFGRTLRDAALSWALPMASFAIT